VFKTTASAVQANRESVLRSTRTARAIRRPDGGRHLCTTATQASLEPTERSDSGGRFGKVIGFSLSFALAVSALAATAHIWANAEMIR
jgi:hypothetical protein